MLSGGQKQRVTLARALVRDAPFLLLDDPFSAVDSETEERILEQLRKLRPDLTTLLVTHRVSAARHADQVFVLDAGRLVESGQHRDLLAAGGFYARLAQTQLREGQLRSRLEGEERA
jgi:ATP-binding cassette subfamily B protein